ncbi:uncharacterized protein B0I36DRAFT_412212 [Microdochium trichocladiopsis]|uniref:Peptidase M43 pregnancy-associated plasma-A domain-containing protein n=1 Tax=Microdochium trichocladiopsis TaxID=1682393 RepID=A0A9P9BQ52_9PEZI|nr:uncharacterized protein B0I36DRAFT_412212 [Microdochium trichocladiopsis]KAH7029860.1 hypothetical protein B0I36DRAFT_412212 [Microdochium trichocladiopsis]
MVGFSFPRPLALTTLVLPFLFPPTVTSTAPFQNETFLNLRLGDYYDGPKFKPPPYLTDFSEHLNDIEVEYLEYIKQLTPVNEPPTILSSCLMPATNANGTTIVRRGPFRKLRKLLQKQIDRLLPRPPTFKGFKYRNFCSPDKLTIYVYYHVVVGSYDKFSLARKDQIDNQTRVMNEYYNKLGVMFEVADINWRINPDFATSRFNQQHPHRRFSRSGTYADLNVWIVEDVPGDTPGESTIGYATFPDATANQYERSFDGVVMIADTLPGSSAPIAANHKGTNLIHEVGHWLGLFHVFNETLFDSTTCFANPDRDSVPDTKNFPAHRPEIFANQQVPCGETEPVEQYNFMSYSTQKGLDGFGFTSGQAARIFSRYIGVRQGLRNNKLCHPPPGLSGSQGTRRRRSEVDNNPALPPDVLDLLRQDNLQCAAHDAVDPVDISLAPPPDPAYPEYPVLPIQPKDRRPVPPIDPSLPQPAGSGACIEAAPKELRLPGLMLPIGGGGVVGVPPVVGGPGENDNSGCPAVCSPHPGSNKCHVPSAQNCVFPAPLAGANPRSYCACRPGYKSAFGLDASKHWRVATKGIENFVWVAEGVECETLCDGVLCSEVPVLSKPCV